jgi:hypothetical protein
MPSRRRSSSSGMSGRKARMGGGGVRTWCQANAYDERLDRRVAVNQAIRAYVEGCGTFRREVDRDMDRIGGDRLLRSVRVQSCDIT